MFILVTTLLQTPRIWGSCARKWRLLLERARHLKVKFTQKCSHLLKVWNLKKKKKKKALFFFHQILWSSKIPYKNVRNQNMNHAIFWAFQSHTDNIFVVWTSWNVSIYTDITFCPPNLTLARIKFKRYDKDEDSGFGKLVCSEKKTHNRDLKWIHNSVIEIKYSYLLITKITKAVTFMLTQLN